MIPIEGQPILTAAQMRAAEEKAIAAGSSVEELMERAGAGVAEAVRRLAAGAPVLVLCGPGNNGGDGYVAARIMRANGLDVSVVATGGPRTDAATVARSRWNGAVGELAEAAKAPILVDALFGTGLSRGLGKEMSDTLWPLQLRARLKIAVDLPSGVSTDTGEDFGQRPFRADLTLALGAVKPAHVLQPAAWYCGNVRLLDIGLGLTEKFYDHPDEVGSQGPVFGPNTDDHKYSRGLVVVVGGSMPGAGALAALAAAKSGAGYVLLLGEGDAANLPHAIVQKRWSAETLKAAIEGKRNVSIVIGPGLGRDEQARAKLKAVIDTGHPLVIDGDAIHLIDEDMLDGLRRRSSRPDELCDVLTPHGGEFVACFGKWSGSKLEATRSAASLSGCTVVFKGPDTVIAHPDGRTSTYLPGSKWLSTAGTGDVLAGAIGTMLTSQAPWGEAEAGVWMHSEAARRLGASFIADDLAHELSAVRALL